MYTTMEHMTKFDSNEDKNYFLPSFNSDDEKYKNYHYYSKQHSQDYNGYQTSWNKTKWNIKTTITTANNTAKIIMAIRLPEIKQNKI